MSLLYQKAQTHVQGSGFLRCSYFYRNKPPDYFNNIQTKRKGLMEVHMSTGGNDPCCPIHNNVRGVYFNATVSYLPGGGPIPTSPYGSDRLLVPASTMKQWASNLYFCRLLLFLGWRISLRHSCYDCTRLSC